MSTRLTTAHRSPDDAGFTLVEVVTSALLLVAVLGLTLSTIAAIHSIGSKESAELAERSSYRSVLKQLEEDLKLSSTGRDPKTNQPRFQIFIDGNGRQAIRYQKLLGARVVGGELEGTWSDFIEVHLTPEGMVTRTEDGRTRNLGSGLADLTFAVTASGRFQVFCTTRYRDPENGHVVEETYEEFIVPKN